MKEAINLGKTAADWWRYYKERDRGSFARLRRVNSVVEALMEPATIHLARRLGRTAPAQMTRNCILAAVLAHVREDDTRPIARAAGRDAPNGEQMADDRTAKLKYGRFKRLMQSDDDELLDQMRRLVHLLGQKGNVADLTSSILFWGDRIQKRWVFDYYGLGRDQQPAESDISPAKEAKL